MEAIGQQRTTTSLATSLVSSEQVEKILVGNGWDKTIAGDNHEKVVKALQAMWKTGRGLLVTGPCGCGKTHLARCLFKYWRMEVSRWLYVKDMRCLQFMKNSPEFYYNNSVVLDDIGSEEIIKDYGNTVDVVGDFIQKYHYYGKRRFIGTTNLNAEQLGGSESSVGKYGPRVLDRLLDMCVVLKMSGKSKRERIVIQ